MSAVTGPAWSYVERQRMLVRPSGVLECHRGAVTAYAEAADDLVAEPLARLPLGDALARSEWSPHEDSYCAGSLCATTLRP